MRGAASPQCKQRLHAPLVARAARLDALPQPDFFLRQFLVEALEVARLVLQRRRFLLEIRRIAAGPRRERATIEFDDPGGEVREEGAIVGDEEQRSRKRREVLFQPADRVDVQMVGRLVEQQDVRLRHQRLPEQRAAPPAAGELTDLSVGGQRQP